MKCYIKCYLYQKDFDGKQHKKIPYMQMKKQKTSNIPQTRHDQKKEKKSYPYSGNDERLGAGKPVAAIGFLEGIIPVEWE